MLYKVTPMMAPPQKVAKPAAEADAPKQPRKRRKSAVYDADGHEVLITMMCLKCRSMKPLAMFGLRKMADGAIRNQPWCRTCRSGASSKKKKDAVVEAPSPEVQVAAPAESAPSPAPSPVSPAEPLAADDAHDAHDADDAPVAEADPAPAAG